MERMHIKKRWSLFLVVALAMINIQSTFGANIHGMSTDTSLNQSSITKELGALKIIPRRYNFSHVIVPYMYNFYGYLKKSKQFDLDVFQHLDTEAKTNADVKSVNASWARKNIIENLDASDTSFKQTNSKLLLDNNQEISKPTKNYRRNFCNSAIEKFNNKTEKITCLKEMLSELYKITKWKNLFMFLQRDFINLGNCEKYIIDKKKNESEYRNILSFMDIFHKTATENLMKINVPIDFIVTRNSRTFYSAFGLKKILLPVFIGMQIMKSILIALFLPSILGTFGKIVGKGLSSFAQSSQNQAMQPEDNFNFKDNVDLNNNEYMAQPLGTLPAAAMYDESMAPKTSDISRYDFNEATVTPEQELPISIYPMYKMKTDEQKQHYKVFHEIPTSSLMLTNYDPFYSPLLSRLDAVFSRLGHLTESCRELAVCAMYKSPARFAPYSNLVSAQLSRELNELRKPSADNPNVLRFFRYMKAAKDGQDGVKCESIYTKCNDAQSDNALIQNQAMIATYQDINKLVHARNN